VDVQIAHLAGSGGYEVPAGDQALQVFVDAIARKDPRAQQLWFDVTTVVMPKTPPEVAVLIARRIRELGVQRVLFGSDAPTEDSVAPKAAWAAFRTLPLTEAEFQTIASNMPPYMR
jgi:predicted TIM-barrel fold metal-dependent hydrolase